MKTKRLISLLLGGSVRPECGGHTRWRLRRAANCLP
mgnify:CR=1 FL=1